MAQIEPIAQEQTAGSILVGMNPKITPPHYFQVPKPNHFRLRPDLLEELCFLETLETSLPKGLDEHEEWVRTIGFTVETFPYEWVHDSFSKEPPRRVIFSSVILRGERERQFVIITPGRLSVRMPFEGLYAFVFERAIELAVWHGFKRRLVEEFFFALPLTEPHPGPNWRFARWAIGYEPGTGLCSLLAMDNPSTEIRYLNGEGGYFVPSFTMR